MTKEIQIKTIATNQKKEIESVLAGILKNEKPKSKFKYCFLGDCFDLMQYYGCVESGNYKKAYSIQINLDTDPREQIKNTVYNFIERINEQPPQSKNI